MKVIISYYEIYLLKEDYNNLQKVIKCISIGQKIMNCLKNHHLLMLEIQQNFLHAFAFLLLFPGIHYSYSNQTRDTKVYMRIN